MITLLKLYRAVPHEVRLLVLDLLRKILSGDSSGAAFKAAEAARKQKNILIAKRIVDL